MIWPGIKIAVRNFKKNPFFGLINIVGLGIGLLGSFLILLFIQHEFNFDKFLEDKDRIYQVVLSAQFGGDDFTTSNTSPPIGNTLKESFPEIEEYTRHYMPGDVVMRTENQLFTESNVWLVDSNFLTFFAFPIIEGDPLTSLRGTKSLVLTASMAEKYFGKKAVVGESLYLQDELYTVTAVLADLPQQSSLQFDALAPVASSQRVRRFSWSWVWLQMDTYVKVKPSMSSKAIAALEAKFPAMVKEHAASAFARIGQDLESFFKAGNRWELSLNPLTNIHLYSGGISSRLTTKGSIRDVYIFGTVGFFLLLLACINFMNLSTAQSIRRSREVGVRKVLGSNRQALIGQFLSESMFFSLIGTTIALILLYTVLPTFNQLMNRFIGIQEVFGEWMLFGLISIPLITGFLAGSYPAFYLSGFNSLKGLKGQTIASNKDHVWIRSSLVVFQFAISIALIICTSIVLQQIYFSTNGDLGMTKDPVLIISNAQYLGEQSNTFKNELESLNAVEKVSMCTDVPMSGNAFGDFYVPQIEANSANLEELTLYSYMVDDDFVPTLELEILEGRNFDEQRGLDSAAVLINEATVRMVGWENPIGKTLTYPGGNNRTYQVIGVMRDFHNISFHQPIEPFALFHESSQSYNLPNSSILLKVRAGEERDLIRRVEELWANLAPASPFQYSFLNESIDAQYQSEERLGAVLNVFTWLSVFIACLGLLGLITYSIDQRTKEIGIRKVLGATVGGIVGLLSKEFLVLVAVAFLLASPVAYYTMENWLQDFAYRIPIEWWIFLLAGGFAVGIAFLTIGIQSMRAALANPVEALRNEG